MLLTREKNDARSFSLLLLVIVIHVNLPMPHLHLILVSRTCMLAFSCMHSYTQRGRMCMAFISSQSDHKPFWLLDKTCYYTIKLQVHFYMWYHIVHLQKAELLTFQPHMFSCIIWVLQVSFLKMANIVRKVLLQTDKKFTYSSADVLCFPVKKLPLFFCHMVFLYMWSSINLNQISWW